MFIGHFALGFAGKRYAPTISLGLLFLSVQFVDLLWPTLLLLDLEHVRIVPGITLLTPLDFYDYPISHSLVGVSIWGGLFALVYFFISKNKTAAIILGLGVVSHWFLDALVHRPDLPILSNSGPMVGLGLWNSMQATMMTEGMFFAAGFVSYLKFTEARNRAGSISLWALVAFLVIVWLTNFFGEPPPNVTALAIVGQAQWLLILWGWYVDRNRQPVL